MRIFIIIFLAITILLQAATASCDYSAEILQKTCGVENIQPKEVNMNDMFSSDVRKIRIRLFDNLTVSITSLGSECYKTMIIFHSKPFSFTY